MCAACGTVEQAAQNEPRELAGRKQKQLLLWGAPTTATAAIDNKLGAWLPASLDKPVTLPTQRCPHTAVVASVKGVIHPNSQRAAPLKLNISGRVR